MAIVDMRKISLLGMNQDRAKLFLKMQKLGCVEVAEMPLFDDREVQSQPTGRLEEINKRIAQLDQCIYKLSRYDTHKKKLFEERPTADADQVSTILAGRAEWMQVVDRVEEIDRTRNELRAREARCLQQIEQFKPWENLDVPLQEIRDTQTTRVSLYTVPSRLYDTLAAEAANAPTAVIEKVSQTGDAVYTLIAVHRDDEAALDSAIKAASGVRVDFGATEGTVLFAISQFQDQLARISEVRGQLDEEIKKLAGQINNLRVFRDIEATERDRQEASDRCIATQSAFMLTGWVPQKREAEVERALKESSSVIEIEFSDPAEGDKQPTLLYNKRAIAPFETIVKMFSMPDPNGVDPTFVMMPFWICFFGMMVSDAGYGIFLAIAGTLLGMKLKNRGAMGKMAWVIALGGVATIFWGGMYGGWFSIDGIQPWMGFTPMGDPLKMMILCVGVGAVHILAGLGMAIFLNVRRGKVWDAICDQGFWIMLLVGLGLLLVDMRLGGIVAGIGGLGILWFTNRTTRNPLKRIMSGLGSLYGITSYLSDLLSYARLFGMGLATGVIGMVINTVATMMMGSPVGTVIGVIILIGGHLFNLGINALGAYVHSCRLQFIEFFSKFYESNGVEFKPLGNRTKYVDIVD